MPINFLQANCRTESTNTRFGVCDDPPPATSPAYIDENNKNQWIAIVDNPNSLLVEFYAIDHCVQVLRPNGDMDNRCDGVLKEDQRLIFVELKSRGGGQWLKKGREQLTVTIRNFRNNHDISLYTSVQAYVCNNLKPNFYFGQASNIQQFRNETGYVLRGQQVINL